MSDLPYEIVEHILLRLPARSILRFKLVCKQWRSLISDPVFVKDHANFASLHQSGVLVHPKFDLRRDSVLLNIISIDYESLNSTDLQLKFPMPTIPFIIGCCNGLWLIESDEDPLVLWNPLFTEYYKLLPKSNFTSSYDTHFDGFGYDACINDYKVVRLYRKRKKVIGGGYRPRYSELEVEVYSLKTNSWKIIPARVPATNIECHAIARRRTGTHVRGAIYWIIHNLRNAAVIAFDLITEKFKLLEAPSLDDDSVHRKFVTDIVEVRGCLGAYRLGRNSEDTVIWIWNEDENKKGGYWTKLLTIPSKYPMFTRVIFIQNPNQVLLLVSDIVGFGKLVIYDSVCMMFRDTSSGDVRSPVHVVETLVSPVSPVSF